MTTTNRLDPDQPASLAVRSALDASARRLTASSTSALEGDAEAVHQMRVAARRLRSDLRTFAPLLDPAWCAPIRAELKWLADILGALRDLDVLIARLETQTGRRAEAQAVECLLDGLRRKQAAARQALSAALASDRYERLTGLLVEAACAPRFSDRAAEPSRRALPPLVAACWKKLAKVGRKLRQTDPDAAFHEVRIRAKRLRYAAEAVATALPERIGRQAAALARAAAKVQTVLGEHQDAILACEAIQQALESGHLPEPCATVARRLMKQQKRAAKRARKRFPEAWDELDRKRLRRWLRPDEPDRRT
jgi:CHAD domain-containing protein